MDRNIPPTEGDVMLVLSRRAQERIVIKLDGKEILITALACKSHNVMRFGIEAPPEVKILREEIIDRDRRTA